MSSFIRGEFEGNGLPWDQDPASELVDRLEHELAEELEADGPEFIPVRRHGAEVGRLIDEDGGRLEDTTGEALASRTYDQDDLSAEEAALHYIDDVDDIDEFDRDEFEFEGEE